MSPVPTLSAAGATYVELVRNTPLTLVFFFAVFVLPQVDIILPFFVFAVMALTIYHAAFFCEAVPLSINAVGVGQAEAARSIGLTFGQTLQLVVLPQAIRTVIPPLINVVIALIKNRLDRGRLRRDRYDHRHPAGQRQRRRGHPDPGRGGRLLI